MNDESIVVVGPGGRSQTVSFGDPWPLPYRGSRYSLRQLEKHLQVVWWWQEMYAKTERFAAATARSLRTVGKPRGSFCVTSHGALLTKVPRDDGAWKPMYAGRFSGDITFAEIDTNPGRLDLGMYWTGFPFHHGEVWYVSPREKAGNLLMWRHEGLRLGSSRPFPQLYQQYLKVRPRGGRLYITENGHIWMNLPDDEISDEFREEFARLQRAQVDELTVARKGAILRLLTSRLAATKCRPIYLGPMKAFDGGEAPWTYFTQEASKTFGSGSDDSTDDDVERAGDC